MLLFLFCVLLIIYFLHYNRPLLYPFSVVYYTLHIVFTYISLLASVFCWCMLLIISSICSDGSFVVFTSSCILVFFVVVWRTAPWQKLSMCLRTFLSYSLGNFPLISIRCAQMSVYVLSISRHHNASPFGSRGQGTRQKFSSFSSAVKLVWLNNYSNFQGIHNNFTSLYWPLAP